MIVVLLIQREVTGRVEVKQTLNGFDVLDTEVIELISHLEEQERGRKRPGKQQDAGEHEHVPQCQPGAKVFRTRHNSLIPHRRVGTSDEFTNILLPKSSPKRQRNLRRASPASMLKTGVHYTRNIAIAAIFAALIPAASAKDKKAKESSKDEIEVVGHVALTDGPVRRFLLTEHYSRSYLYAERDAGQSVTLIDVTRV